MKASRIMMIVAAVVVASWAIKMFIIEEQKPNEPGQHLAWFIMIVISLLLFLPALIVGFMGY
jgi:nitrogen fixation/metabolism regulation signal transduction histidine kinase